MKKQILFITSICLIFAACNNNSNTSLQQATTSDTIASNLTGNATQANDSLALLALTKELYKWRETHQKEADFSPLQQNGTDTLYTMLDMQQHQQRLKEMEATGFFTQSFIDNYNKIALAINKDLSDGKMQWHIGDQAPFGYDADPWCNCQDVPDDYLDKIDILQLSFENGIASYNWGWGEGLVYSVKAVKEGNKWKIDYLEGFDYDGTVQSFQHPNDITGKWENAMVTLNIGDDNLAFEYHGQCVYFYPIKKINDQAFDMIWSNDMDCKFDNGVSNTFGLKEVPVIGKPFAKYTLRYNTLYVEYYYKTWVEKYSKQINADVFTSEYKRKPATL